MLRDSDTATIRFALTRRLDKEPGSIKVVDIKFQRYKSGDEYWSVLPQIDQAGSLLAWGERSIASMPFLRVGVHLLVGQLLQLRSRFDLPSSWEIGHLRNEIDEIAEQCKRARKEYFTHGMGRSVQEVALTGSGLRGRWSLYG